MIYSPRCSRRPRGILRARHLLRVHRRARREGANLWPTQPSVQQKQLHFQSAISIKTRSTLSQALFSDRLFAQSSTETSAFSTENSTEHRLDRPRYCVKTNAGVCTENDVPYWPWQILTVPEGIGLDVANACLTQVRAEYRPRNRPILLRIRWACLHGSVSGRVGLLSRADWTYSMRLSSLSGLSMCVCNLTPYGSIYRPSMAH